MCLEKLTLSDSEGSQDTDGIQHDSTPTPTPTPTPTATSGQTATPVSTAPTKNVTASPAPPAPAVPGKLFFLFVSPSIMGHFRVPKFLLSKQGQVQNLSYFSCEN